MKTQTSSAIISSLSATLLFLVATVSSAQTQPPAKPAGTELIPEPAIAAILAAFDKYEVVALPEAHGLKDLDDFIFSLIRNPSFPDKVNDIAVECGNSLYQPVLDRYIAGEDVPFTEVRKVWRNTTQRMCGESEFFEQFFPLVRAINQKFPAGKRLRVLAGDPPINWDKVKGPDDMERFLDRDGNIAAVMKREVLSKHRKALMLFGTFHLMHRTKIGPEPGDNAVSNYEKDYPNVTFVIDGLSFSGSDLLAGATSTFISWPVPSLARVKDTWLGALDFSQFSPTPIMIDENCKVHTEVPKELQRPMADLVDAFLYLGPQDLALWEKLPADIGLDTDYRTELQRRDSFSGFPGAPGSLQEADRWIVSSAEHPIFSMPKMPDPKDLEKSCLEMKESGSTPPK